ncbi:MAG: ROK family protein [Terracidiphilus sp.]
MPDDHSAISSVHAFDIGGSHISAACCAIHGLRILRTVRAGLPPDPTADQFLDLLCELSRAVTLPEAPALGAVLAVPGPFDLTAGISRMRHKLKSLYGMDLRAALAERFGWDPAQVSFINDAAGFLLGEIQCGAARGAKKAIGIVLGTGIGSAFARDGDWLTHGEGIPPGGEIWNLPYGPGIVEDLLSTRAIKGEYAARTAKDKEVVTIAAQADSDLDARAVFHAFGVNLGQVIRDVLAPFSPDIVVLGGGISVSASLFLPFAQDQLTGLGFKLVTSSLLDKAPLLGAAAYWQNGSDTSREAANQDSDRADSLRDGP